MTQQRTFGSIVSPIDDESGYGVLCRIAILMGFRSLGALINHLLGDKQKSDGRTHDRDLTGLVAWASQSYGMSPQQALDRFSNLPLHRPFSIKRLALLNFTDATALAAAASTPRELEPLSKVLSSSRSLWWRPLGVPETHLQYCPQCAQEQYDSYGFTTWLRSHNVAEVSACGVHSRRLLRAPTQRLVLPLVVKNAKPRRDDIASPSEVKSARCARALLDCNLPWIAHDSRARILRRRLAELDEAGIGSTTPELHRLLCVRTVQSFFMPNYLSDSIRTPHILSLLSILFEDMGVLKERFLAACAKAQPSPSLSFAVTAGQLLTLRLIAGEGE